MTSNVIRATAVTQSARGDVLTADGRMPAIPALGPATFPRPGAANPSLTTLALAAHHATAWPGS